MERRSHSRKRPRLCQLTVGIIVGHNTVRTGDAYVYNGDPTARWACSETDAHTFANHSFDPGTQFLVIGIHENGCASVLGDGGKVMVLTMYFLQRHCDPL